MKIFEFHFNPTLKKDTFFKTFFSENLYFVGELSNALPQNSQFLDVLVKEATSAYNSSHRNMKETLQRVNAFLAGQIKSGNTDWVGNLHMALMGFSKRNGAAYSFSFAKSGSIKVFVARRGMLLDVGKDVHDFKNFVTGTIHADDKVIVCTKELQDVLTTQKSFDDLIFFKEEKQFKELFRAEEKALSRVSGTLFSILIEGVSPASPRKILPNFTLPQLRLHVPTFSLKIKLPAFSVKKPRWFKIPKEKRFLPLAGLVLLLIAGFFLFKNERDASHMNTAQILARVHSLEAQQQYMEAWQTLSPLLSQKPMPDETVAVQKEIETKLKPLYFVQEVQNPKIAYELKRSDTSLIPHDIALQGNYLYLSNPFAKQIFILNLAAKKGKEFSAQKNVSANTNFGDSVLFWGDPNMLILATGEQIETQTLSLPVTNFSVESLSSFGNSAYLFDSKQGQIIKVEDPTGPNQTAFLWFTNEAVKKAQGAKSVAVDGGAWLLNKGSEIQRYYGGSYQESLNVSIFPALSQATKLKTAPLFRYLYLLEPSQGRIILFTKAGELIKQYQSDSFEGATDFAVSLDEKTLFVLAGSKIFEIER